MKKITTFIFVIVSFSTYAQDKWVKIEEELYKKMQTAEFVNSAVNGYSLKGMPREVIREHMVEVYKSRDISKLLVKELRQAGIESVEDKDVIAYGRKFGAELFLSMAMKGMARLSTEEQRVFLSFMNTWLQYASVEDCKWMMTVGASSSATDSAKIEMKYYEKFRKEELRSYYRFIRKAIFAELNNFPYTKTINQDQVKIADDAFQTVLEKKIKQQSIKIETLNAMTDMNNSSAKDVCDAGKLIFSTLLEMKGFTGDLMVTKFILSMQ